MALDWSLTFEQEFDARLKIGARRLASAKLKRLIDIVGASSLLLLLAPLLLLVAAFAFVLGRLVAYRVASDGQEMVRIVETASKNRTFIKVSERKWEPPTLLAA